MSDWNQVYIRINEAGEIIVVAKPKGVHVAIVDDKRRQAFEIAEGVIIQEAGQISDMQRILTATKD